MIIRRESERRALQEVGKIVANCLQFMHAQVEVGISTKELDDLGRDFLIRHGAQSAPEVMYDFPGATCISLNYEAAHGVPSRDRIIAEGDIINIDVSAVKNDFYGDSAYTFAVGEVAPEIKELLRVTKESLEKAIEVSIEGQRIGDIGYAVQSHAEAHGYGVVRELVGHGLGHELHEAPEVPNYGRRGRGIKLQQGMVLAIEPMINLGVKEVRQLSDGWTIVTSDGLPSAHFEHDVAVMKGKAEVLSTFEFIEEALKEKI